MHTDDLHQADADRLFLDELASEDAQAAATVSIGEPERGPFGITIRTVRTMPDGTKRPHLFRIGYEDQDLLEDDRELKGVMYGAVLADYWATRREKIGRHYGIREW